MHYRVNDKNAEWLVLTFLPHHSTPLFTTMLSVLPTSLPPSLKFLNRYINALQNPPREAFVQAAVQNPSFFSAFNQYILQAARAHAHPRLLLSVWASVMVQSVDAILTTGASARQGVQQQREEDLYTRLFPVLNEAMSMKKTPELVLGCYMIILILVGKANLSDEVLNSLMKAISRSWTDETYPAGLSCLAQVADQRQARALPKSVVRSVSRIPNLKELLIEMSSQQTIDRFVLGMVEALVKSNDADHQTTLLSLMRPVLQHHLLTDVAESAFIKTVSRRSAKLLEAPSSGSHQQEAAHAIQKLLQSSSNNAQLRRKDDIAHSSEDMDMIDEAPDALEIIELPQASVAALDADIGRLTVPREMTSYLNDSKNQDFEAVLAVFERACSVPDKLETLLRSDVFGTNSDPDRRTTFMVRAWTTSSSAVARAMALETCLKDLPETETCLRLCNLLIPCALVALGDSIRSVRSSAVRLLQRIGANINVSPDRGQANENGTAHASIEDYTLFLSGLVDLGLEECVTDRARVKQTFKILLGTSSEAGDERVEKKKKLRSAQKANIYSAMCASVSGIGSRAVRQRLLSLLTEIDKVAGKSRSKYHIGLVMRQHISEYQNEATMVSQEGLDMEEYDAAVMAIVHPGDDDAMSLLLSLAIGLDVEFPEGSPTKAPSPLKVIAAARLRVLWPAVHGMAQQHLATTLLDNAAPLNNRVPQEDQVNEAMGVLQSVPVKIDVLNHFLENLLETMTAPAQPAAKKQRGDDGKATSQKPSVPPEQVIARLTLILELIDSTSYKPTVALFHSMFKILPNIQRLSRQTGSELSYMTTLALNCLSSALQSFEKDKTQPKLDTSVVRTDFLVDCVSNTSSAQARNSALMLLSMLVKQMPQLVLHSVMPIFTMMSSTTVRQTDDFSAHVVNETIQAIVPVLSHKLQEQRKNVAASTAEILLSFAAAFEHIPPHRRTQLFSLLASSLGPQQSLFAIIATLVDQTSASDEVTKFASTLFTQFGSETSMSTIQRYIDLVTDGLKPKPTLFQTLSKQDWSGAERDSVIIAHLRTISLLLQNSLFRTKVSDDLKKDPVAKTLRATFAVSFEHVILMSQGIKAELRAEVDGVLESLLITFPFDTVATTIEPLFGHRDHALARTVLRTIEQRIRGMKQAGSATKQAMIALLPRLTSTLTAANQAATKPATLTCIDAICEKFGKSDTDATLIAMQAVATDHCLTSSDPLLRTLSLQCLASSIEVLGNDFIPLLHTTSAAAVKAVEDSLMVTVKNESLHDAAFAFFSAVEDHLPFMVSKDLAANILTCALSSVSASLNPGQCLQLMSLKLEAAVVIQASQSVWDAAVARGNKVSQQQERAKYISRDTNIQLQPLEDLISTIKSTIENQPKSVVARNARDLSSLFLKMLDLRRVTCALRKQYTPAAIESSEDAINQTFIAFVLKVNDATFRPFFLQLLDWSSTALLRSDVEDRALRTTTLFNITRSLSERLRSIFTSYFNNLVERAAEVLSNTHIGGPVERDLRTAVVSSLTSSFKHDQDDFWQAPTRFDPIVTPLILELSSNNRDYVTNLIIPAITELAAAAASDQNHKAMNSILLKQFRADNARTRLAAVKCQQSLSERLGDQWLDNLSEMLPFINELQEDDDENVEKETHRWVKIIEEILGESLGAMLQ